MNTPYKFLFQALEWAEAWTGDENPVEINDGTLQYYDAKHDRLVELRQDGTVIIVCRGELPE